MKLLMRGSFVYQYLKPAAQEIGIELVDIHSPDPNALVDEINEQSTPDTIGFLFFASFGDPETQELFDRISIPKIFWGIEDPNHFPTFVRQAKNADIIFTTAQECVRDYQTIFPRKPVYVLTWACEPTYHYPNLADPLFLDREFDIVFVGNRYPDQWPRVLAESAVLLPAIKWAKTYNKKLGVWGLGDDSRHSWKTSPQVYPEYYQKYTHALEAADIYRNAVVVLCMNEQVTSPTMTSMRTYEACATGNVVLSHDSPATQNLFGDVVYVSQIPEETANILSWIFTPDREGLYVNYDATMRAQKASQAMFAAHTYAHRLNDLIAILGKHF